MLTKSKIFINVRGLASYKKAQEVCNNDCRQDSERKVSDMLDNGKCLWCNNKDCPIVQAS